MIFELENENFNNWAVEISSVMCYNMIVVKNNGKELRV